MEEMVELDAAKMVTFIYGENLPEVIDNVQNNLCRSALYLMPFS